MDTIHPHAKEDKTTPETTFIYALIDPVNHQIRYVGKSDNPTKRLKGHINEATRRTADRHYSTHKSNWIRSVLQAGNMPILHIIEKIPLEQWKEREVYWIAYYREHGAKLTNIAPGGIAHDYSPETIAKASAKKTWVQTK